MSGTRRKSKHPQKWEESIPNIEQSQDLKAVKSEELERDRFESYKSYSEQPSHYNSNLMPDKDTKNKYSHGRDVGSVENEMTVLDVLHGSRQGFIAECKTCSLHLKDWTSTATHIQYHEIGYIPPCAKEGKSFSNMQIATCMLCQKVCHNLSSLANHVRSKHSLTSSPFVCPFCRRSFKSCVLLQKHVHVRDVCLKCPVCSAMCDQIYELFAHLSDCLPTFHPHLKSLICHICNQRVMMRSLSDHMIHHCIPEQKVDHMKQEIKEEYSPAKQSAISSSYPPDNKSKSIFLCEICDGRFFFFDTFRRHLFDHVDTKMYCPLCYLKGFEKPEMVSRHMMLRCPRRSREQFEFGSVISLIGKEKRHNFIQVIKDIRHLRPFRDGLLAWASYRQVQEFLMVIDNFSNETGSPPNSPTDIDLLTWLNEFEQEIQKHRLEADVKPIKDEKKFVAREPLRSTGKVIPKVEIKEETAGSLEALATVPTMDHRPRAQEIRKLYPGVTLLPDVDFNRLKPLYDEAMKFVQKDVLSECIDSGAFAVTDFIRLEWEAQTLRGMEPFYVKSGKEKEMSYYMTPNPFKTYSRDVDQDIDPEALKRISRELKMMENENSVGRNPPFSQAILDALLLEAKGC